MYVLPLPSFFYSSQGLRTFGRAYGQLGDWLCRFHPCNWSISGPPNRQGVADDGIDFTCGLHSQTEEDESSDLEKSFVKWKI